MRKTKRLLSAIRRAGHGRRWQIQLEGDHIVPLAQGGSNAFNKYRHRLQAVQSVEGPEDAGGMARFRAAATAKSAKADAVQGALLF
jgi:hypothetical protein